MATSLAAEVKRELGTEVTLVPGRGGIFDVRADGELIYSKSATGRFPNAGEVTALLKAKK
jgi:selenoprotein W-related protein